MLLQVPATAAHMQQQAAAAPAAPSADDDLRRDPPERVIHQPLSRSHLHPQPPPLRRHHLHPKERRRNIDGITTRPR